MTTSFKVIDIFAGPGGLAEGFSSVRDEGADRIFEIALSVEKETSAFRTLRLRAFTRQFESLPDEYYEYLSGEINLDDLIDAHSGEWDAAVAETEQIELGTKEATEKISKLVSEIRDRDDKPSILLGGPPCQAYSLVGRARNRGVEGYDAKKDNRHFLYKEYISLVEQLRPAAFVMENVKGMLSSKIDGRRIFEIVLEDLKNAGGDDYSYVIKPLAEPTGTQYSEHVLRSENFGVPQNRHRVILLGIRSDFAERTKEANLWEQPLPQPGFQHSVRSVLEDMPKLRSGLSKSQDGNVEWKKAASSAFKFAADCCSESGPLQEKLVPVLIQHSKTLDGANNILSRTSSAVCSVSNDELKKWLTDSDLTSLQNQSTRGHMESDLARYAFAATYAEKYKVSPKASEFPEGLAPEHRNWSSGKFADRFRVQRWDSPSSTITSHISKDGHYFIHPDPLQCRSLTVREAARLQTFPDNYFFEGNRTQQYVQVGNAVPPFLARQIALHLASLFGLEAQDNA